MWQTVVKEENKAKIMLHIEWKWSNLRLDKSLTRKKDVSWIFTWGWLTPTWVGVTTATIGRAPGEIVVKRGTLLTVISFCVVHAETLPKHLEHTSSAAHSFYQH